jgi:hypothetical protein
MKKLACILLVIGITVTLSFAQGTGKKYPGALNNDQITKSKKEQKKNMKEFTTEKRYTAITKGGGSHRTGKKTNGASNPGNGGGH